MTYLNTRYNFWTWLMVAFILLGISKVSHAWDSSSAYNTIAMSYTANTTITQIINLNSTQQAATTINFVVDVKNGGGRPTHDLAGNPLTYSTQTDSATITIYRYNSAGTLLGSTVSSTYILKNLGSDPGNGFSTAPGDNKHPFTQASVTYTGSLTDTAYIKIEMKGTDGAWWAGNYGAQWRTPTVTVGSNTTNIVYNSEFGLAPNGVKAQGWTPNYGSWANCGVTSGNSTCVTQESGVTANMWGGGYDANGGTTSGQSGGYSGTLTSDNATQAASGTITPSSSSTTPPPPPSIPTGTSDPSSGSSLYPYTRGTGNRGWLIRWWDNAGSGSWSQSNASYTQGGTGGGFYSWVTGYIRWPGAMDGVSKTISFRTGWDDDHRLYINGTQVTNGVCCSYAYGSYTAKPGEILLIEFYTNNSGGGPWSFEIAWDPQGDGTYEVLGGESIGQESAGGSSWYSSDITATQTNTITTSRSRRDAITLGNRIDLDSDGSGNSVTIEQVGSWNKIQGIGGGDARIAGFGTSVDIKQGDYTSGKNLIELYTQGNGNNVTLSQARNTTTGAQDGSESGGHYMGLSVTGDINTVTMRQGNDGGSSSGHFSLLSVSGNFNNITIKQANDNEKRFFGTVAGSSNSVNVTQQNTGLHYLDLTLTGNGNSATVLQQGSGGHHATISLTNAGGASSLNLTQQGATNQVYSIQQTCANAAGCSVSVTQQ